ncbi:hypothetical protein F5Y19DRAFT_86048 [Xylariaceae sp. FL1651]|nr:hypothetical protein F5Y19DRAFT_86048 [Xylariaceae sp. FL1651]
MAATRPALSVTGCSHCRSLVLNLFASNAPRSAPIIRTSSFQTCARTFGAVPIRRFSSLPKPNVPITDSDPIQNTRVLEGESSKDENVEHDPEPSNVPWYLQVEPPTHVAPIEPPPLPEIPPDAPPLIGLLLEYVSEEMGLDALSLLDLRKLDPPPALGPNLFMLFGTARSERHLNVSAGRLVRWLRAKHRIHADADGLLGPNERKTKLRRKARRAKLLGTMGTDDADDGIRTGWVCVNLGTIDRGGPESTVVAEDGRVSGFGVSQTGSTIVVQIMTESRRSEMGLEMLWTRALDGPIHSSPPPEPSFKDQGSTVEIKPDINLHQVEKIMLTNSYRPSSLRDGRKRHSLAALPQNQANFYSTLQRSLPSISEIDPLNTSSPEELERVLTYDAHQKLRLLEMLRTQLDGMDAQATRAAFSGDNEKSSSTPFLDLMELAMQTLPPTRTWEHRLAVRHKTSVSELSNIVRSLDDVRLLVEELRIYGIQATRAQYLQLLSCIFHSEAKQSDIFELALSLINTMHQRNESIMASDLLVTIIDGAYSGNSRVALTEKFIEPLETLLFKSHLPCMDEQLLIRLMMAYARQGYWSGIWNIWRVPPRYLRPRSANMYICIFKSAANSGSRSICMDVLRRCAPEMSSEEPPVVPVGNVRKAILECIQIADPQAQVYAEKLPTDAKGRIGQLANREFVKLTRVVMSAVE